MSRTSFEVIGVVAERDSRDPTSMSPDAAPWTPERFYREYEAPAGYDGHMEHVHEFVEHSKQMGRKVVLITVRGRSLRRAEEPQCRWSATCTWSV